MEEQMNYPKNIVAKVRQEIEETNRRMVNSTSAWDQWAQFDAWDQGTSWSEVNAAPQTK